MAKISDIAKIQDKLMRNYSLVSQLNDVISIYQKSFNFVNQNINLYNYISNNNSLIFNQNIYVAQEYMKIYDMINKYDYKSSIISNQMTEVFGFINKFEHMDHDINENLDLVIEEDNVEKVNKYIHQVLDIVSDVDRENNDLYDKSIDMDQVSNSLINYELKKLTLNELRYIILIIVGLIVNIIGMDNSNNQNAINLLENINRGMVEIIEDTNSELNIK
ncbi:MAG: hypothetical protein ACRCW0_06890 [Clostridium sp.]